MAADANPVFEVATIKRSRPEAQSRAFQVKGRQFFTFNTSLSNLITFAYGVHVRQITGGPAWMESEKYDLTAGDAAAPPDLFTAFQEQLGLRLESTKAPAEVFVIDRVEKPSEN